AQPAQRPQAGFGHHVPLYHARPIGGPLYERPPAGDEPRPHRRKWPGC
nr:hypothetical protein [Tanacetum cinerariifolium]